MFDPVILCSYLPGEGYFQSAKYDVRPILCRDDLDYYRGIAEWWDSDRVLINIEHDIAATDDLIAQLLACPDPLCTGSYRSHWISCGLPEGKIAVGNGDRQVKVSYHLGGEEWADWSAVGLVKISPAARIAPLAPRPWSSFEISIEESVARPWHVHWGIGDDGSPVEFAAHHHW